MWVRYEEHVYLAVLSSRNRIGVRDKFQKQIEFLSNMILETHDCYYLKALLLKKKIVLRVKLFSSYPKSCILPVHKKTILKNEHGYFECIGSGVKLEFFSTLFNSTCLMNMRVSAIDRYTLLICGKNKE